MKLKALTVIGLNSGTSMDGVDAAIFRIGPRDEANYEAGSRLKLSIEMLGQILYEFPPVLRRKMKAIIAAGHASLEDTCRLDAALGEEFANAVKALLRTVPGIQVDLIGSHGQTIWHAPKHKSFAGISCANTMQLGQAAIIAERTGIPVVGDFRVADMAAGGQGAPLVSFADEVIFGSEVNAGIGILNIGGIANLTAIDKSGIAIMAFDTGPGNMLIDRCCEKLFDREFDEGGALAAGGTVAEEWIQDVLKHPYFDQAPPKTTGRELLGLPFADLLIEQGLKRKLTNQDIIASISAITPASIAQQYDTFIKPKLNIEKIVLGGGGAENSFIIEQLKKRWTNPLEIARHEDYGISTKFKEALLFALLAYTNLMRIPNNVPACTGASRRVCMGKLCSP